MSACCGCSVFAYEYPGYSVSDGEPSETNCYEAADAAYRFLTVEARIDPSRVVVFGRSLGTGPAVDLCSRIPDIGGCILQSPLESAIRCAVGNFASYALYPVDIFRSHQKIGSVACPVLIMHGTHDALYPVDIFRSHQKIGSVACPVLIMHGTHEYVCNGEYQPSSLSRFVF
eukprot:CAMPEP_0194346446 /NCGR_PEP_ID=MMETSP0171-20130528/105431_1 /TAXON_ID=218684 /ORGANISM="Corethron pennatum, Strain L29A3" /LENGTH=171 /DNA_ID=CAMNT_0039113575 /DNA_START=570 /DNA_END=1085 /DNA_ORIENTATION=-